MSMLAEARRSTRPPATRVFTTTVVALRRGRAGRGSLIALASLILPGPLGVPEALQDDARLGGVSPARWRAGRLAAQGVPRRPARDAAVPPRRAGRLVGYFTMAALSIALALAGGPCAC